MIAVELLTVDNLIALALAVALTGFLMVALLFPEKF